MPFVKIFFIIRKKREEKMWGTVNEASPLLFLAMQATSPASSRRAETTNKAWHPCSLMMTL